MPKQTWTVLLAELFERFSYYGIKSKYKSLFLKVDPIANSNPVPLFASLPLFLPFVLRPSVNQKSSGRCSEYEINPIVQKKNQYSCFS